MKLALGVDFGGTKVEAGFVTSEGLVVHESRFRRPTGGGSSSDELAAAVRGVITDALATLPAGAELLGVGVGSAGPIGLREGTTSPLNVPAWRGYPIRELVVDTVPDVPVTFRMDGLCIALAEHWVGAGRGYDNVMGMIVSTGIGGGLVVQGQAVEGPTGNAGHIGHVEVGGFDVACKCGGIGCVEAIASGPKSVEWAVAQGWTGAVGEDLAASYAAGDPIAVAAIERAGRAIGQSIASATSLVDLELVAIGGGFSHVSPDLFDIIRTAIDRYSRFDYARRVEVLPTGLDTDGPLIGAAALVYRSV